MLDGGCWSGRERMGGGYGVMLGGGCGEYGATFVEGRCATG